MRPWILCRAELPQSLRIWGWVLVASSALSLITFSSGTLGSLSSGRPPSVSVVAVLSFLVTLAAGIGLVNGWRTSWFLGLVAAVASLALGVWYLSQVTGPGAPEYRVSRSVIWLGPGLLFLLCLFLPASLRWMRGEDHPWRWPMPPPPTPGTVPSEASANAAAVADASPRKPSLLLPAVVLVVAASAAGSLLWLRQADGEFPQDAAGFRLSRSATVDAGVIFGPPVTQVPDQTQEAVEHRLAVYEDGTSSADIRLFGIDLSGWPHETLLLSAGARPAGDQEVTAERVDGVTYTCASVRSEAMCVWTDEAWTGWARSEGPLDIGRLTDLVSSVHVAAT